MSVTIARLRAAAPERAVVVEVASAEDALRAAATGADVIVTGSAVFDGKTPEANARFMLETVAAVSRKQ